MKRTSWAFTLLPLTMAALVSCTAASAAPPTLQSQVDVFDSCIEQAILVQLRLDPASRSPEAVNAACATHRSALDALLGSGARVALDASVARHVADALGIAASPAPPAP